MSKNAETGLKFVSRVEGDVHREFKGAEVGSWVNGECLYGEIAAAGTSFFWVRRSEYRVGELNTLLTILGRAREGDEAGFLLRRFGVPSIWCSEPTRNAKGSAVVMVFFGYWKDYIDILHTKQTGNDNE